MLPSDDKRRRVGIRTPSAHKKRRHFLVPILIILLVLYKSSTYRPLSSGVLHYLGCCGLVVTPTEDGFRKAPTTAPLQVVNQLDTA